MFGPDPLSDPFALLALWLILIAAYDFATAKTPFL